MALFDKIINFKYNNQTNITLLKIICIYYLLIANNYTKHLYSGQLTKFIQSNKIAQLIISYITILFITINFAQVTDIKKANFYSSIAFIMFIMSTKLDLHWNIAILLIIFIAFFYENDLINRLLLSKSDQALDEEQKDIIKKETKITRRSLIITIIIILIIGVLFYANSKYVKYGDNFNLGEFVIGKDRIYRLNKN